MQVNAGAAGICCQKLDEVEAMAQAGIRDIFLPYNIVGEAKLKHLMGLTRRVQMSVTADSEFIVKGLSDAATREGTVLPVLVETDTGDRHCGVRPPQEAVDLARIIARLPNRHYAGLMTYPHHQNSDPFVRETKRL